MVDNIIAKVNEIMPAVPQRISDSSVTPVSGMTTSSVTQGAGGNGDPTADFAGLLRAISSGLDKGTGNLQNGTFINADGKTVSLAELMQGLFINNGTDNKTGPDKKTDSRNSMTDLLQQMIGQLQTSVAQPYILIAPGQSLNAASSDTSIAATGIAGSNGTGNGTTSLIAVLEQALQKSAVPAANGGENVKGSAAQQNLTTSVAGYTGNLTPDAIVDNTALTVMAQQNLPDNAGNPTTGAIGAATLNAANNAGNPTTGAIGAATLNAANNAGNPTTGAIGAATLNAANNAGNPTTGAIGAATLNAANNAGNQATNSISAATLNAANNAGNQATNSISAATLKTANNAGNPTSNEINAGNLNATNNAGNPATNAMNSATLGANGVEVTVLSAITQKNPNSNTDSTSLNAEHSALCAAVPAQQTQYANDAKPAQEAIPVSRLGELSEPIMKTLASGDSNLTIKLSPPDMGTIQIKLKMENGILTADIKVDSTAVKDMFTTVMPQIKQSIESSGIKTGNFFTDLKEDSFKDGRRQQDDTNQRQQRQQKEQKTGFFDFFA